MKSSCKVGHGCKYRTVLFCFILSKLAAVSYTHLTLPTILLV